MSSTMKLVTMTICLAVCSSLHAQTAPAARDSKPLSTSLGSRGVSGEGTNAAEAKPG
jgi:hypothetical protein